jgi:putative redox protein
MSATMTGAVSLLDGMALRADTGSGHTLTLDVSPAGGGQDRGPRPIELVLLGLAGCTAMDVISILRKMRQDVTDYRVTAEGERADEHPRVYTSIVVEHAVTGHDLDPALVRRAVDLSTTRYCPVEAMLRASVPIRVRIRLIDAATGAVTVEELDAVPA